MILRFPKRILKIELNEFIKRYWFNSIRIECIEIYDYAGEKRHGLPLKLILNEFINDFEYNKEKRVLTLMLDL